MSTGSEYPTRPSWTAEQAKAMHNVRLMLLNVGSALPQGSAPSPGDLIAAPIPDIPEGVHITPVLVNPADGLPNELLEGSIAPSPVACFIYSTGPPDALPPPQTRVVLWVHGGGNVLRSPVDQVSVPNLSGFVKKLGEGTVVIAPAYRLATVPENRFPANVQDVFSAYVHLLRQGYDPTNITVGGESAGGNSALVLAYILAQVDAPPPAKLMAIAPAAELTYHFSEYAKAQADADTFAAPMHLAFTAQWLGTPSKWQPSNPFVSAAHIPSIPASWPAKTLIICGAADQLIDGSRIVVAKLKAAGKDVQYNEAVDMPHAYQTLPVFPAQAAEAWDRMVDFILTK